MCVSSGQCFRLCEEEECPKNRIGTSEQRTQGGETAQLGNELALQAWGSELEPQKQHLKSQASVTAPTCNPGMGEMETGGSLGLTGLPSWLCAFQAMMALVSKTKLMNPEE